MIGRALLGVVWVLAVAFALPPLPTAEETVPPVANQPPAVTDPSTEPVPAPDPPVPAPAPEPAPAAVPPSDPPAPPEAPPTPPEPSATKPEPRPRAFAAAPGSVTIDDFAFRPSSITVGVGETVTWRNEDSAAHTATATDGSFDTGLMDRGESRSARFDEAGTFSYLCEPHPFMKGTVRVVAQTSSGDGGESDDASGGDDGSTGTSGSTSTGTATDTTQGDALPATGADPLPLALTGLGLLLIGTVGRRRAVT